MKRRSLRWRRHASLLLQLAGLNADCFGPVFEAIVDGCQLRRHVDDSLGERVKQAWSRGRQGAEHLKGEVHLHPTP